MDREALEKRLQQRPFQPFRLVLTDGSVFDIRIPDRGIYPVVSHSFASVDMGELALLNVGNVKGKMGH